MKRLETDKFLTKEAKRGNQKAFNALFSHYYLVIYNYINSIVKDPIEAEDLTMITFEKAFAKIKKYAPLFEFGTWVGKIAKNTTIDYIDYRKRRPYRRPYNCVDVSDFENLQQLISQIENPEKQLINKESGIILDESVNQLYVAYKEVILLRYYEDRNYDEICSELNINGSVARKRICLAKRNLNKILLEKEAS